MRNIKFFAEVASNKRSRKAMTIEVGLFISSYYSILLKGVFLHLEKLEFLPKDAFVPNIVEIGPEALEKKY